MSEAPNYAYYLHDNAAFRGQDGPGLHGVDHVHVNGEWKPYKGEDRIEPVMFGRRVSELEALAE